MLKYTQMAWTFRPHLILYKNIVKFDFIYIYLDEKCQKVNIFHEVKNYFLFIWNFQVSQTNTHILFLIIRGFTSDIVLK